MTIPLELNLRGIEKTTYLESLLRRKVEKLERLNGRVKSCRVALERSASNNGNPYRVKIALSVPPGSEIVAVKDFREPDKNGQLQNLVHEAFDAAERQLKELGERKRWERPAS